MSLMQFNSSWDCVNLQSSQFHFSFVWFVVTSYLSLSPPLLHLYFVIFSMLSSSHIGLSPQILSSSVLVGFFWSLLLLVCLLLCSISVPLCSYLGLLPTLFLAIFDHSSSLSMCSHVPGLSVCRYLQLTSCQINILFSFLCVLFKNFLNFSHVSRCWFP